MPVLGVYLHGLDVEELRGLDQLRVSPRVAVVGLAELAAVALGVELRGGDPGPRRGVLHVPALDGVVPARRAVVVPQPEVTSHLENSGKTVWQKT